MLKKEDIRIRDPFIVTDNGTYYMYGTTNLTENSLVAKNRFSVYSSKDLESFDGPFVIFDGDAEGFWATRDYWAAEVWKYNGKFYLFGSFKSETHRRASQILVSDSPMGPFKPISEKPITPEEWECLDGTLWVENGTPYMVFCHEWVQCGDGEMCAVELSQDLSRPVGEPFLLFKASDNPYVEMIRGREGCMITDGPFLFRENGMLKMIWSSMSDGRYSVLEATADGLKGEWTHHKGRFDFDGGHAMIFEDLNGKKFVSLHQPNTPNLERAKFIPYEEA